MASNGVYMYDVFIQEFAHEILFSKDFTMFV